MNDNDLRLINSKKPYSDVRLPQTGIDFLWDIINHSPTKTEYKINNEDMSGLADFKNDTDNWFFENILSKECANDTIYKFDFQPTFSLTSMWVNHQKQHEFVPPHIHDAFYSFVVFMKIPTHFKEQQKLGFCRAPRSVTSNYFVW